MNELQQTENSLWHLTDTLSAYFESREMVAAQLREPQEDADRASLEGQLAEIDAQLARLGTELATKTDNIAGVLRRMATEQDALKAEQERIHARRKTFERAEDWLRKYVVHTMQERGLRNLKTQNNTLFLRSSDAVVVTDPAEVPEIYKTATVKMPMWLWNQIVFGMTCEGTPEDVILHIEALRHEEAISLSAIKRDIKAGVTVPGADLEFHESLSLR